MNRYHVTFSFLADSRDFGIIKANSKDEAERQVLAKFFPGDKGDWGFLQGCMRAKEVRG